jgi:hypothetical protein
MTIGEIVRLRIMPEEAWEVIDVKADGQACLQNTEAKLSIWARDEELMQDELPDRNALVRDFLKSNEKYLFFS